MSSVTLRPSRPPLALMSSAQSWEPCWNAFPSAEKSPVRESDTPILIGVLDLPDWVPEDEVPEPEQPASMRATAPVQATARIRMGDFRFVNLCSSPRETSGGVRLVHIGRRLWSSWG